MQQCSLRHRLYAQRGKDDQPSKSQFDLMIPHPFSLNGHIGTVNSF